jgi:hypothetical protein
MAAAVSAGCSALTLQQIAAIQMKTAASTVIEGFRIIGISQHDKGRITDYLNYPKFSSWIFPGAGAGKIV